MTTTTWRTRSAPLLLSSIWLLSLGLAAAIGAALAISLLSAIGLLAPAAKAESQPQKSLGQVYSQSLPGVVQVVDYSQLGRGTLKGALGSGFVVDLDGHILTNHHVIDDLRYPGIVLSDGSAYPADLVGDDTTHDLAVLMAPIPREKLHPLSFADSRTVQIGEQVLAIGSPFGLGFTLTTGIVSFVGRRVELTDKPAIEDAIQTDAALNPGNSGGPLLDTNGEVVGVNTVTMLNSTGIAFAIPSRVAKGCLDEMVNGALRTRPWLGVTVEETKARPMGTADGAQADPAETEGAMLAVVLPGSPADKAQLRGASYVQDPLGGTTLGAPGDVVVAIDGVKVESADDLSSYLSISGKRVGEVVRLDVVRDGKALEVSVRLAARYDKQADLAGAI